MQHRFGLRILGFIALVFLLNSCGAPLSQIKQLPGYRDSGNPDGKTACSDAPENSINVTIPASQIPPGLVISLNHGETIYDACDTGADPHGYFNVYAASSTTLDIQIHLPIGTPLRTSYFGTNPDATRPPIRSDLSIVIAQRTSCTSPALTLSSRDNASIQWSLQKGSHPSCSNDWTAYAGNVAF